MSIVCTLKWAIYREDIVPLTKKGAKIREAMEKFYGEKKGDEVFYASINKGKIKGAEKKKKGK